jgi:hypothetical protein
LIKDDVKVEVPNKTPKTLIPLNGMVNWDGVLKSSGKLKGDHAMHFSSWIKKPITWSSVWKIFIWNDTIERGPMM